MRARKLHSLLALLGGALLIPAGTASAASWRLEAWRTADGGGQLSGEAIVDPGTDPNGAPPAIPSQSAKLQLVRGGVVVSQRETQGAVSGGFITLDAVPQDGDQLRYFSPKDGPVVATADYIAPVIGADMCAGRTSFAGTHPGADDADAGATRPGGGDPVAGSAALTSASAYTATLEAALPLDAIAWVSSTKTSGETVLTSRTERRVVSCATPPAEQGQDPNLAQTPPPGAGETAPGSDSPPPPVLAPVSPADTAPPLASATARKGSARNLARYGYAYAVNCNEACSVNAVLTIDAKTARKLKLGRKAATIARGTAKLESQRGAVTVRALKSATKRLRKARPFSAKLVATVTDAAGNATSLTTSVKFGR